MEQSVDVAVIGGGVGGVAAALAACDAGCRVMLSEPTGWIGGQMTSQGVSALDEHRWIEQGGASRSYRVMRAALRQHYRARYGVATMPDGAPLNPGDAWVSALCFEPRVALEVLEHLLAPHVADGRLLIWRHCTPLAVEQRDGRIDTVVLLHQPDATLRRVHARVVLDASETGDVLPLAGIPYRLGAEARHETGEADAPEVARPGEVQSFTFCFAVEYCPGEDHTVPPPPDYAALRDRQPFTLTLQARDGTPRPFRMFATGPTGLPPFWTYRRLLSARLLAPHGPPRDLALINWNGNDYHDASFVDVPPAQAAAALDAARRLSLAFLYWLQTEVPRDDGGVGYPELRLMPEVMGTADGLSQAPYVRESRRIVALQRIVAEDVLAAGRDGARSRHWDDTVGVGWYPMDLHPAPGNPRSLFEPTLPFQIPLGALIPLRPGNLVAAAKNIGTTHLSNGSYRLHPVEWGIGEAAGTLAAYCCASGLLPHDVWHQQRHRRALQYRLARRGVPLGWALDLPEDARWYPGVMLLVAAGALPIDGPRAHQLLVQPSEPCDAAAAAALLRAAADLLCRSPAAALAILPAATAAVDAATWQAALAHLGIDATPDDAWPSWVWAAITLADACAVAATYG